MNSTKTGNDPSTTNLISNNNNKNNKIVFLYYTESNGADLRNRVYRYVWNG
jgi:hypothetical protein